MTKKNAKKLAYRQKIVKTILLETMLLEIDRRGWKVVVSSK